MTSPRAVLTFSVLVTLLFIFSIPISICEDIKKEHWMGIYSGDKRVGYSYNSVSTLDGITEVNERTQLKIDFLGEKNDVETQALYKLKDYKILSFEYKMKSDSVNLEASGKRHGDILKIKTETISGVTERELTIENELILPSILSTWIVERDFTEGESIIVSLFEPLSILMGTTNLLSKHKINAMETIDIPLGNFSTIKIISDFMGSQSTSWITQEGEVIKQEFPPGLVAIKESKEDIQNKKSQSFDIAQKTSIPANLKIDDPRDTEYLKIKLKGIDLSQGFDIDDGYRQYLDGQILEIKSPMENENIYTLPYSDIKYKNLIEAENLIQSDDEEIIEVTQKVINGESDPLIASKKINKWIYKNIKKSATVSIPNAKDVLKTKVGDCNEHAALFTAMARSAGIPTKTVLGTIYYEDRFYYHAWNEVYVGQWIAVDSTYGQLPADATHVKLIEGDISKSGEILKVVGKINIEILDAS